MKERMKRIRKDSNLTQAAFAEAIGATRAMVSEYEIGRVTPDKSMQMLICSKFNVNERWLETGEGEPYKRGLIPQLVHALRNAPALQAGLERLLDVMDDEDWRILNEVVRKAMQNENSPEP